MPIHRLDTFTDRREALALFDLLRSRDPSKPWPLLTVLAFIAPGGSGKSTLMEYLRLKKCSLPDGRAVLPYAHLDFTLPSAPKDLLSIMVALRDQLQQHADGQDQHLTFPRFDLGALIAQATATKEDLSALGPQEVRRKLAAGKQIFESLKDLGSSLGYTVPFVPPLLAGLTLAGRIPAVKDLLSYLEEHTGWQWYRQQGTTLGLMASASMKDVLLRLYVLSRPGKPEREQLVNDVLPAAFVADLYGALVEATPPQAWTKTANVVLFLDGYEALQHASSSTAMRLLQVLSTEPRKKGQTDPLLLVVGSRDPLVDISQEEASFPFERTLIHDEATVEHGMRERYIHWQHRLPPDTRFLRLKDLYLPLWLRDFGPEDTRSYLVQFGEREHAQAFAKHAELVQTIDRVTRGHPLFLALAAEAALEAEARGRALTPMDFEKAEVSPRIAPEHEAEQISDYLLALFLRQLSDAERKDLIFCAMPRVLDAAVVHVLLPSLDELDVQQRWQTYRRLSFLSAIDEQRSVFHPLVRRLLLRRLTVSADPASSYARTHRQLRDHFDKRAHNGEEQARIEAAYHALALGDPDPAIGLGTLAQQHRLALWQPLVEAVTQAPTDLLPATSEERAEEALTRALQQHEAHSAVTAIVLYTWLLSASQDEQEHTAGLMQYLGIAYRNLPSGDQQANLQRAIACYQAALQVYTRETFPFEWAGTQNNLGNAYRELPSGDRAANLERAIACFQAALQVRTREAFPVDWAMTQHNLGNAYGNLPSGDQQANLQRAIACYQAALQVYTRETFPFEWASTQHSLGNAYAELPSGDRVANLERAIACYQAALQVYTRWDFPFEWASTQNNLGMTYTELSLSSGDRVANLERAIACYQAALQVYTRETFPRDWASTQHNLGIAYCNLPSGDEQADLQQAIACYQAALQVYTREDYPRDWATTQHNLGIAYANSPSGDQQENLQRAIACFQSALQFLTSEKVSRNLETAQDALQKLDKSDGMQ